LNEWCIHPAKAGKNAFRNSLYWGAEQGCLVQIIGEKPIAGKSQP
jgi:hypothetical protein